LFAVKNLLVCNKLIMFQVTFSEQSLSILNDLPQNDQLKLMDTLSSLTNTILNESESDIGKFRRDNKLFYRLRIDDLRIYFEKVDIALHCLYILPKNSLNDFLFRCKLPSSEKAVLENHQSFWDYLESLKKK
jgi:mRNA-degrading endonuclease RelE of RelBE toxin-antitoxin system